MEIVDVDAALVVKVSVDPASKDLGVDGAHDITLFETTSARRNHSTQTVVKWALGLHCNWCLVRCDLRFRFRLINRRWCRCRNRSGGDFVGILWLLILLMLILRMAVRRSVPVLAVIFFLKG